MNVEKIKSNENQETPDSYELLNSVVIHPTDDILRKSQALLTSQPSALNLVLEFSNVAHSNILQFTQLKQNAFKCPQDAALLVIDVQWDFVRGSLRTDKCPAGQDAIGIMNNINHLLKMQFKRIFVTADWHPADHCSFYDNRASLKLSPRNSITNVEKIRLYDTVRIIGPNQVEREQTLWPTHCVANTKGAQIHPDVKLPESYTLIKKGTISMVESYSAFGDPDGLEDTGLNTHLKDAGIKTLILCGIAFDVCIAATALEAIQRRYQVIIVHDATVGIKHETIKTKRGELLRAGAYITQTSNIPGFLSGQFLPLQHVITAIRQSRSEELKNRLLGKSEPKAMMIASRSLTPVE
ncbi:Pyrazinamidase/nicotinamidase [Fasciola gigantica]|uniref:nicotinamidase n=1 Tax=Fasciola gigantica TaxID=46835 RepID=A0A504YQK9_FASGI|nr:Pyrazinamidase/nicotinamidase [Fasciola gigantica]